MFFSRFTSRIGMIAGVGCTIHCFFEYICDFVVCSGEFSFIKSHDSIFMLLKISNQKITIAGESMHPTLETNNILVCNKMTKNLNRFKRNDIVVAIHPSQPNILICKRLIAIGGDVIIMGHSNDRHYETESLNPTEDEEYEEKILDATHIFIKRGSCWLEGDNKLNSTDSRNYGQLPIGLIKSKVLARIWPLSQFKTF